MGLAVVRLMGNGDVPTIFAVLVLRGYPPVRVVMGRPRRTVVNFFGGRSWSMRVPMRVPMRVLMGIRTVFG